jgi:hypothetical protein
MLHVVRFKFRRTDLEGQEPRQSAEAAPTKRLDGNGKYHPVCDRKRFLTSYFHLIDRIYGVL